MLGMTKLGFHVASSNRNGAGDLLKAGAALVVCVDQNMIAEAKRAGACVAFRTKKYLDNPEGIDKAIISSIPALADAWMQRIMPIWAMNQGADYYLLNNEWDIGTPYSGKLIGDFAFACMRIADANGFKLGVFNFSTGCPSDNPVNGVACSMEKRMNEIMPALIYATNHGHAISLHVHALNHGNLPDTGENIALRYQRFLRYCAINGLRPKVIITELSNGVGGIEPNPNKYLDSIHWWDLQAQAGEFAGQLVGGALYGFNAAETLSPLVSRIAAVMRMSVTPTPPPANIVNFRGTCPEPLFEKVSAAAISAGASIEVVP
jgi:hypothetical protein